MNKKYLKYITYILIFTLLALPVTGCNGNDGDNGDNPEAAAEANPDSQTDSPDNPEENPAPAEQAPQEQPATPEPPVNEAPANTPIAERSPVEVTRIEPEMPVYNTPTVTGTGSDDSTVTPPENMEPEVDPHYHEPTPNLFPIDECQVEINGVYDSKFAKELVDAINAARTDYMIGPVTRNTSLLACADIRCKEQSYFIGHFRPNGTSWQTVAPGYVQGECIAVDYRKAADVVEAWLSVNQTRVQLMNPDYTQIGTSVYNINGNLFIAAEFGW